MLKKKVTSVVAIAASCILALGSVGLNVKANADNDASNIFTGGTTSTQNLFEAATFSDANYIYNQYEPSGALGGYIKKGVKQAVGGYSQLPVVIDTTEDAVSYAGAKLTLSGTTTLDMGVVDLSKSQAEDTNAVIGFLPTVNYAGPQHASQVVNPYLGIYYTFRSTVNPDKYFDIAMRETNAANWKYPSVGVAFNGKDLHYGQTVNPENPDIPAGKTYVYEENSRIGGYSYRFNGSIITSSYSAASTSHGRVYAEKLMESGKYDDIECTYNYPMKVFYDYETSKFYVDSMEYQVRKKMNNERDKYVVVAEDNSERYLLADISQPVGNYGEGSRYNSKYGWTGFTEEEAKSVAVTMHVDWNPEYTGNHDIVITDFAGQAVTNANADSLKANKGTSGLLKEFTSKDGVLSLNDSYKVNLSDNDIFTKLVSFEVYPEQMGTTKATNNSGLHEVSFNLSDGINNLQINLKDFSEDGTTYRNCFTVSVNGEDKWAQNQEGNFRQNTEFGYPIPYHFDRYIRHTSSYWVLDQYSVDDDEGETQQPYSHYGMRVDINATSQATINIYYNAADNCLYADTGYWNSSLYTSHTNAEGVTVKRWKIADLGNTYDGAREAFAGFGDSDLSFSMTTTLDTGFDSAKIRILEVDGQKLGTDKDGKMTISVSDNAKVYAPSNSYIVAGENVSVPAPYRHNLIQGVALADDEYTIKVIDPNGKLYEEVAENKFDFTQIGNYTIEYFVNESSVGKTILTTAVPVDGELVALSAFNVKENLMDGDVLALGDLSIVNDVNILSLENATIIISKDGTVVSSDENVTAEWTSSVLTNGVYKIVVKSDTFVVSKTFEVKTCIKASGIIENGSVKVNGVNDIAMLLEGNNTIQIIANEGYQIDTFVIAGNDVTAEIINGYYTYKAEDITENIYYTASFKKLTYTVTFMAGEDVIATEGNVEFGTLLKDVTTPEIPAKEGYEIKGWSEDGEIEIKSDVTVYAIYTLKTYTITFDVDGGSEIAPKEYTAEEIVTAFDEEPVKEGYIFDGWYLGETKFVYGSVLTEDITLTAKWVAVPDEDSSSSESSADSESSDTSDVVDSSDSSTSSDVSEPSKPSKGGCFGSVSGSSFVVCCVALAAGMFIKRKNDKE